MLTFTDEYDERDVKLGLIKHIEKFLLRNDLFTLFNKYKKKKPAKKPNTISVFVYLRIKVNSFNL